MTPYKWLRLCGTTVSAAMVFLLSCACLAGGIGAQSAESAIAGPSLSTAAPSPFLVAPTIPLGYAPSSVAAGDLRQSGKLDLVTADYSSGSITVFLGAGKGKFTPGVEYAAGSHPSSVQVADLNGDGRPDILVTNQTEGTISVLFGNGDGTFQARQSFKVGFNPSFIATGDFNGSGKMDVAVTGASGKLLAVFLNDGNGNLQRPVMQLLSKTPTALAAADFNHDGHTDLALANADGTVSILLGKGAGMFRSVPDLTVAPGSLSSIESGDLSNSGKIDLIVTDPGRKLVTVLIGKGDGTFASPASYPVGNEPVSTVVADVNGDGVPALVVINKSSNTFSILGGNGDGTFKSSADFVAGNAPLAAVAGDFYGNGHVDLAIINHSSQTVSVPLGNGDGTFKAARSFSSGAQPMSVASGTLNGGKIPALVVANYCGSDSACGTAGTVAVFLADEKGDYRLSSTNSVGAGPVSVALADLNGDRKSDIVALNRLDKTVSVMLGLGDGTFRQPMTFPLAGSPLAVAVGDLNKDGKLDLAVLEDCGAAKCSQPGNVEVLLGGGDGSFRSVQSYSVGYSPTSIAMGDINGDKNLDLVIANRCGNDASCHSSGTGTVLLGDGTGRFSPGTDVALGNSPSSIALGKLTGSALDLVVARSTDNTVAVLHGNGDGTFKTGAPYAVGNQPGSLVVADFNGDGKPDVAVTNLKDSTVSVLFGKGDGTLHPAAALPVGSGPIALAAVGSAFSKHAGLATANGSSVTGDGSSMPGTEFSVLPNLQGDPPLTTFTVVPSPAPNSNVNDMVTLTATLTGVAPNLAPTGTVTFDSDPGTGAVALSDCTNVSITPGIAPSLVSTAVCITQMLTAGSDAITGVYSGDGTYDTGVGETSPSVTQTVAQLSPTLTLSPSAAANLNTAVTFTATLSGVTIAPIGPSGTVSFTVGGNPIACNVAATVNPATGVATCTTSALLAGTDVIGASYPGDGNYALATAATINQTINQLAPTLTISPSAAANLNAPVTFTATLAGVAIAPVGPSGTVGFTVGGNPITCTAPATVNAATGVATCTTSALLAGTDVIGASYPGDGNYQSATAATINQTVNQLSPTLTISPSGPVNLNAPVTFTATLGGVVLAPTGPSGTVSFTVGGNPITCTAPATVNAGTGVATCTTSALLAGTDVIGASYPGDANYKPATAATINQTVNQISPTLTISPSGPVSLNAAVTFTATLGGVSLAPTGPSGTVSFTVGGNPITCSAPATVNAATGVATCTTSALLAGTDVIGASYPGDSNYKSATAATINQTVNQLAPTLTISPSAASSVNAPVTFTATLSGVSFAPTGPSGTVGFTVGGNPIACSAPATVNATTGVATCTTSALLASTDVIGASYPGDSNYKAATAATINQTVNALAASMTLTPLPGPSVAVGATVTFTAQLGGVALTPVTPSGTVTFTVNGVANGDCPPVKVSAAGAAACVTASLLAPADVIDATYSGDPNFTFAGTATVTETVGKTGAITTLTSLPASPDVNQQVTFTATVKAPSGSIVPTGSVTFTQGATQLCPPVPLTVNVANATANCAYAFSTATAGSTITATYSGDANFASGAPGTFNQVIAATSTTSTLTSVPSTSAVNQQVAFTATVTPAFAGPGVPAGNVVFSTTSPGPATVMCTEPVAVNGTVPACNFTFTSAPVGGVYSVKAVYTSSNANFISSTSAPYSQTVGKTATSTAVVATPPSSTANQMVTFTATVTPAMSGTTNPTGTVAFSYVVNGGAPVVLCASSNVTPATGVATCTEPLPADGNYTISAVYSGDANFATSTGTVLQPVGLTTTTTAVTATASTSTVNQSVTFTATVTPSTTGATNPTGSVTFSYTNSSFTTPVNLCSSRPVSTAVSKTTATCVATLPGAAADTITATYSGDVNFATSTGSASQTVNQTSTTTNVVGVPAASTVNQQVTFTATITPSVAPFAGSTNPTGTVAFTYSYNGGGAVPLCSSSQSVSTAALLTTAQCTAPLPSKGNYTITAVYTGDSNFTGGQGSAAQTVNTTSTTTTVISSSPTSIVNQTETFTATVAPTVSGITIPTGSVTFNYTLNGGPSTPLSCAAAQPIPVSTTIVGTTASCVVQLPSKGSYTVTTAYSGDANFGASLGSTAQVVNQALAATSLVSSLPSSAVNQAVTFTATITPPFTGPTNPTGTVTFTSTLGGGPPTLLSCATAQPVSVSTGVAGTTAVCKASLTANGNYTITATYSGDTNFTSPAPGIVIQPVGLTPTTTTVVSSLPSSFVNETVKLTATVLSTIVGPTPPTGTVAFTYTFGGGLPVTLCATSSVASATGVATCTAPLPAAGSYAITASYSGDKNFATSSNQPLAPLTQIVNQPVTSVGLTSSVQPTSVVNQTVAFTATINPVNTGAPAYTGTTEPTGTVTFTDTLTNAVLCTEIVAAAGTVPPCNFAFASPAANTVTATYSGDTNFPKSTSPVVTQTVNQSPTTTTLVSLSANPSVNQAVTFTATVAPATFSGSVFPTGTVTFSYTLNGGAPVVLCNSVAVNTLGTVTTASCTAPLPSKATAASPYTITATYSGDKDFVTGLGTVAQVVAGANTTTTVVSTPAPSTVNQPVTFTATVAPSVAGATPPTGTVLYTYVVNGGPATPLNCTVTQPVSVIPATGISTCTAPLPAAGGYTVTAAYSGDSNFGSSSNFVVQTVTPAILSVAVTSSQSPSLVNVPVTFTATLKLPFSAVATPTSTVTFFDSFSGFPLCSNVSLINLTATCVVNVANRNLTDRWTAAIHTITATYNGGDPNFPTTTSPVFSQTVTMGPTKATVLSSSQTSVATQMVTFTATIVPAQTGPVAPSGVFKFTTTGSWNPTVPCPTVSVIATGAGTATAICTAQFPANAESQTITATYENDPNFTGSSSSVAQTVQNFTIANSVTSALDTTATPGPVYLTQGYSTATTSAAGTDPFNPTTVRMVVTSTGGFADTLGLACQVRNAISNAVVTDPSCTVSATAHGATGTALTYNVTSSSSTPVGEYAVTLTATDNSTPALASATTLTVYVVGEANILSLAQGASGTENASFNTTTAPVNATFMSFACGTVFDLTAKKQLSTSQIAGLTCTGPASVTISGATPPPPVTTSVPITISTLGTVAQLQRTSSVSLAAFLGIPLFALMGWVGTRKSPRKNFFRFLGLILLLVGVSYASGCGGSFTSTSQTTSNGILPGSYLVQVVGTDNAKPANKYYAVVPLDVSAN